MKPNVINFHITDKCNYHCRYCFASFSCPDLPLNEAKRVIDSIAVYFAEYNITDGRINIAGGEPSIYPHLDAIIDYIYQKGIRISIISNGSHLSPARVARWRGKVEMIGLSIDAASENACKRIGRCQGNSKPQSLAQLTEIADAIHGSGIRLKINTVVSKLNLDEDMLSVYRMLKPDKIKMLCVHISKGMMRNGEGDFVPSDDEYREFVRKNRYDEDGCNLVIEKSGYMENSYFMIDPQGEVVLNEHGTAKSYGNCRQIPLCKIAENLPIDPAKFYARYNVEMLKMKGGRIEYGMMAV